VSSAYLEAREDAAGSEVPALGYYVPYAAGDTLLTPDVPLLVALIPSATVTWPRTLIQPPAALLVCCRRIQAPVEA
jgi:hypothetical protein